jgi:hypothetical protein
MWHEFFTSGLLGFRQQQRPTSEPAGQKFVPNDERSDFLWPKGTKSPLLLGPFSPFWGVWHSGQGSVLACLGLIWQKMSTMEP